MTADGDHTTDRAARHVRPEPTTGRIIGIGASAGGLEALEQLFDALPPDTGMAFVVVQHLSADVRSLMDEPIAGHSEMPVVLAEDNMSVCANHIYLMPPRKQMIIRDRHLVVTDKEAQACTLPIDTFFHSLAQDIGDQAVAIVLSGSGSDGARGVIEVKRAGGLVLAETAASARFDSMPLSAAATGAVDHAYPPRDLARVLCGLTPRACGPDDHGAIYRKQRDAQLLSQIRLPHQRQAVRRPSLPGVLDPPRSRGPDPVILETYDQLLDRFMPPGFLIDEDGVLVDSFAGAEKLLKVRRRRPTSNLLDLLDEDLRLAVTGAIQRSVRDSAAVAISGVRFPAQLTQTTAPRGDAGAAHADARCTLTAEPLVHPRTGARHVLVTFQGIAVSEHPIAYPEPLVLPVGDAARECLDTLEAELASTRETLQMTIEELEASNEEISALLTARRELEDRQVRSASLLEQAEEGARRREQFIAMLSHELRNPLAAVMNATTLIKRQPDGESIARCQAVIERQARHMKRLLDDLLDVSRITRGKFALLNDNIDLRVPIEAAIESTSPLFAERGVTLEHSLPHQAMPVRGDASRLVQVVVNLLSNAANYSPRASLVRLLVTIEGDRGVLRVIDHGVGIEPELQGKIFDLFVQSQQRLDRSRGGLGVGLSLARSIVDLHGGTIEVHSEGPGKGSDFRITMPLLQPSILEWGPQRTPARRSDRCRIVLVDDQEDSREMLRMLLESRDHVVIDVEDGPTAIEVISRERPDVAFIDIGLPMMNGYEVAQRIRNRPELEDVLLVALTGYGAASDISAARAAGFDEHVIKPAELAKLEKILASKRPTIADS